MSRGPTPSTATAGPIAGSGDVRLSA